MSFLIFKTDDNLLEKAAEVIGLQGDDEEFTNMIVSEIESDPDRDAYSLIEDYKNASKEERRVIDGIFVDLTGWSLATLVKKYLEING